MMIRTSPALALAALALLAGCAAPALRPVPATAADEACLALFARVDAAVEQAGVRDAEAARVRGFPHLRVNRLLADLRHELPDPAARRFWLERLAQLDAQARQFEVANLPPAERIQLEGGAPSGNAGRTLSSLLTDCRERLVSADLVDARRFGSLREAATVPDEYRLLQRAAGLYVLTRIPFALGVRAFERDTQALFALPLPAVAVHGRLQRYGPASGTPPAHGELAASIAAASGNPLRLPWPDAATVTHLARAYAPIFEIDVVDDNDRIGTPYWPAHGPARVEVAHPAVFYRAAQTRVGEHMLLQIVYTAWFPARPRSGPFDLLGGHLDALVWRVTLAADGSPLLFDSMHACGCYHFFFPTPRAVPRPARAALEEWRFIPQALPRSDGRVRTLLRVASGTHYLQRVGYAAPDRHATSRYALVPEATLRALPRPDGTTRSLYGPDGMVAGSERLERFLFWPMGIPNPGAMRQWGHHATAFVGRRHFDAPRLIDERFEVRE